MGVFRVRHVATRELLLVLAATAALAGSCSSDRAAKVAPALTTTTAPSAVQAVPALDEISSRWRRDNRERGVDGRGPYEETVVRCVTLAAKPVAVAGVGSGFLESDSPTDRTVGLVIPIGLQFASKAAAGTAMKFVRNTEFPECLDSEGRANEKNLPYAGQTLEGVDLVSAVPIPNLPAGVDEGFWVTLRFLTQHDGQQDPIQFGFLAVRNGGLVQLTRFAGTSQAATDEASDALINVMAGVAR